MALPSEYYSLKEVAKGWDWQIEKVLDHAKQGKLEICASLDQQAIGFVRYTRNQNGLTGIERRPHALSGLFPVPPSEIAIIFKLATVWDTLHPMDRGYGFDPGQERGEKMAADLNFKPIPAGDVVHSYCLECGGWRPRLVITHAEKTRFAAEQVKIIDGVQDMIQTSIPAKPTAKDKLSPEGINPRWQQELETMAEGLIKERKPWNATKGKLAKILADKIGVKTGLILRQTRNTWRNRLGSPN